MPKQTPQELIKEARTLAAQHGMYVVDKPDAFLLYRKAERPVFIARRRSAAAMRSLIRRCTNTTTK